MNENVTPNKFSTQIKPTIFILTNEKKVIKSSLSIVEENSKIMLYHKKSLKEKFLRRGNYKIVVVFSTLYKLESCEECKSYLINRGNKFLFRLAASKQCKVGKSYRTRQDKSETEKVLLDWHAKFVPRPNYREENLCNIQ